MRGLKPPPPSGFSPSEAGAPWSVLMRVAGLRLAAAEGAQVFQDFGVKHGGTDLVDSRGPLAEVDLAAAITAEGEVLAIEGYQHGAGGAAEEFGGFFLGRHGFGSFGKTPEINFLIK